MKIWGAVSTAYVPIEHTQQSETDAKIDWKEINYGTYLMITFMTCEFLFETDKIKRKLNFSVGEWQMSPGTTILTFFIYVLCEDSDQPLQSV